MIIQILTKTFLGESSFLPWFQVGDLGLSKVKCQTLISGGVRGTLPWMAPELLNGSSSLVSEKVQASIHLLISFYTWPSFIIENLLLF